MMHKSKIFVVGLGVLLMAACKTSLVKPSNTEGRLISRDAEIERLATGMNESPGYRGRIRATLIQPNSKKEVTLSVRAITDEGLLFSAPLGMAKLLVTPEQVAFYNKLDRTYFEGAMSQLDSLLPVSFNFEQLQRLLYGGMVFSEDLNDIKQHLRRRPSKNTANYSSTFSSEQFGEVSYDVRAQLKPLRIMRQELVSDRYKDTVVVLYTYQKDETLPSTIELSGAGKKLLLELSDFEAQKAVNLPFQIPSGYRPLRKK
ncbi:MAG: DUF4292 domain-containing protein [Flavobacteriaceae bacterium]